MKSGISVVIPQENENTRVANFQPSLGFVDKNFQGRISLPSGLCRGLEDENVQADPLPGGGRLALREGGGLQGLVDL
jgi:hypothetical protein